MKSKTKQLPSEKNWKEVDDRIAAALKEAAKEYKIPVKVITGKGRGRPPKGTGKASDKDVKNVLRAVPKSKGKADALTSGEVAKAAGCPTKMASTVLKQLVEDKTIKASGERRARRYWRTA